MAGKFDPLRAEFVAGTMTLRQLAEKHGVSYDGLRRVAGNEDWSGQRHKLAQNATAKAENRIARDIAAERAREMEESLRIARAARAQLARLLQQIGASDEVDAGKLRTATAVGDSAQKQARLALGMSTEAQTVQVQPVDMDELEAALTRRADD